MDAGAKKLLETVTIETLHSHHFSRASSQATNVLTDLLSRYLTVLSSTCAKYAEHAGRLRLTARDAACALDELGVGVEELSEYCATEGREMSRYAVHTARRIEDLNEFKGQSACAAASPVPMMSLSSYPSFRSTRGSRRCDSLGVWPCSGRFDLGRGVVRRRQRKRRRGVTKSPRCTGTTQRRDGW